MSELTYGAVHLRTKDRVALIESLHAVLGAEGYVFRPGGRRAGAKGAEAKGAEAKGARRYLLLPPRKGWTTLLLEEPRETRAMARDLAITGLSALAFVHVDDLLAFGYDAYAPGGELIDAYHSCPDAEKGFDEDDASEEERERTRGNPSALAAGFGLPPEPFAALEKPLKAARIESLRDHYPTSAADAEGALTRLLKALGLPSEIEGFDELWELGLFEEEEAELRALVYGPKPVPKQQGKLAALFGKRAPAPQADRDDDDSDDDDDDDDKSDLEDSRDDDDRA